MSDNIHVAYNEVFDSVAGIEIENSRHAVVEHNNAHHNTGGILAFVTPGLPIKTTEDVIIRNNFVLNNNTPNFGAPGSIVSGIPAGTGILVMAADDVIIEGNIISNNKTAGIIINDHSYASTITMDQDSDPNADRTMILDRYGLGQCCHDGSLCDALRVQTYGLNGLSWEFAAQQFSGGPRRRLLGEATRSSQVRRVGRSGLDLRGHHWVY